MLKGFKVEVLKDNNHPTTLSFFHDVANCRNFNCLKVQIINTNRPGVGWFNLKAVFQDPDPTNPKPIQEVLVTKVTVTVGFGQVKNAL